tara:strand:- start:95 stop:1081 length:987 start_codon:yes stop_codon:yes gene_type:complete
MAARSGPKPQQLDDQGIYRLYFDAGNPRCWNFYGHTNTNWGNGVNLYSSWFINHDKMIDGSHDNPDITTGDDAQLTVPNSFRKDYGGVLQFNGSDDNLLVDLNNSLRLDKDTEINGTDINTDKFSFEIWFRCTLTAGVAPAAVRPATIMDFGGPNSSSSTTFLRQGILGIRGDGKLGWMNYLYTGSFDYNDDGYDSVPIVISDKAGTSGMPTFGVGDTGWQYVAIYDTWATGGSNLTYSVSVNGVLSGQVSGRTAGGGKSDNVFTVQNTAYLGVARDRTSTDTSARLNYMNGQIAIIKAAVYPSSGSVGFTSETAAHNYDAMKGRFGL